MAFADKSKATEYKNEFARNKYDRLAVNVEKGKRELIKKAASITGESVNSFICRLIDAELDRLGVTAGGYGISDGDSD